MAIVIYGILSTITLTTSTQHSMSTLFLRCLLSYGPLLVSRKLLQFVKNTTSTTPFLKFFYSDEFPQPPTYFNRTDVKKAINAPLDVDWIPCSETGVFNTTDGIDESLPPAFTVLPSVIEKNHKTVIVHGQADFRLISEGFVFIFSSFNGLVILFLTLLPMY